MIKNITQTILVLFIIFISLKAEAKRREFPLVAVTGSADIIVVGEINEVRDNSYTFKIKETLKGKKYNLISVEMFKEWTCDIRIEKAIKGQKLCLFLKKKFSGWEIINGSAGELFISGSSIYLGGDDSIIFINNKIARNSISLVQFKNAISDFCKCYQYIGEYGNWDKLPQGFIQICSDLQITNFKNRSKFSIWLFESMERHYKQKIVFIDYNTVFKPLWI